LLTFMKFLHLFFCGGLGFGVSAKGQHPAFAGYLEGDAIESEVFCGPIDFGSLVVMLNGDRKCHGLAGITGRFLCKLAQNP